MKAASRSSRNRWPLSSILINRCPLNYQQIAALWTRSLGSLDFLATDSDNFLIAAKLIHAYVTGRQYYPSGLSSCNELIISVHACKLSLNRNDVKHKTHMVAII